MKTYIKSGIFAAVASLVLFATGCSDKFLDRYPQGGTILQSQYEQLSNTLEGSLYGIYTQLYMYSDHDEFGQRSIDMYTDICSGDMALTARTYNWFYLDEYGRTRERTGYFWAYYYDIIHNTNLVLNLAKVQSEVINKVTQFGFPTNGLQVMSGKDTLCSYTESEAHIAGYFAQALTLRGYAYANLVRYYAPAVQDIRSGQAETLGNTAMTLKECAVGPIYVENDMDTAKARASVADFYDRVEQDLTLAINYFDGFKNYLTRTSKLEVDANVARGLLAYAYLNLANPADVSNAAIYQKALDRAKEIIDSNAYTIIPNSNLLTNGFNNVNDPSWIWGEEVTVENATGLGSFFGQVDIHSYSYAWSGDTKVIDEELYKLIPSWDGRAKWFNDGKANSTFKLCPDKKFFSAINPTSTNEDDVDRAWESDNVFMRIESIYLIAAEAAYRLGDYAASASYLTAITDQRLDLTNTDQTKVAADYATWKSELADNTKLLDALKLNWRVEMWGEGYGFQTLRRLTKKMKRGGNHLYSSGEEVDGYSSKFTFPIPSSESLYNKWIDPKVLTVEQ